MPPLLLKSCDPLSDLRTDQMMLETDDFLMEALFGVFRVGLARRVVAFAFFFLERHLSEILQISF